MPIHKAYYFVLGALRYSALSSLVRNWASKICPPSVCFVSATRMTERDFWSSSPLGTSLKPLLSSSIKHIVFFENKEGLSARYNSAIIESAEDILVFVHDDVWLDDPDLINKIRLGVNQFDVIGVAGNTRRTKRQPAWLFSQIVYGKFILDLDYLSGAIVHGETLDQAKLTTYGKAPATCELLDGVFLAARRRTLLNRKVFFDNTFKFDFYDMDFCRSARQSRLRIGTWPLTIIHQSSGVFGNDRWLDSYNAYLQKWND